MAPLDRQPADKLGGHVLFTADRRKISEGIVGSYVNE